MRTITVKTTSGPEQVEVRSAYKNLCVHVTLKSNDYTITHTKTGLRVMRADNLRMARVAAELLDPLPEWETQTDEKTQHIWEKYRDFLRAVIAYACNDGPLPEPYQPKG